METTELKMINLSALTPSKTNPRKLFDGEALQELAASIKEKGVLQPIVVRPKGKTKYEVVCGHRRYKASLLAEVETIPAVVRDLHDDEALELQIVENLQRKDVHPMDEAVAFLNLTSVFHMEVKEIALRVGKSEKFVAQRLKLNDLIPDFQEMFFQNRMKLSDAVLFSRISQDAQEMILKERAEGWRENENFRIGNVSWYVEDSERNLDDAKFKTEDPELYPEAGPCGSCRHNSANSPLLFEDQNSRICTNPVCFQIKRDRGFKQEVEKVLADPEVLMVNSTWGNNSEKVKQVKEMGVNVLDRESFSKVEKPEDPGTWEEFFKEETRIWDEEELQDSDAIEEVKDDYQSAIESYEEELKEYEETLASGKVRKAFVLEGYSDEGTYIDVILNEKGSALAGGSSDDAGEEIAAIQAREARAKELDQEKIFKRVSEELRTFEEFTGSGEALKGPECLALAVLMESIAGYGIKEFLEKEGIKPEKYGDWAKKSLFKELKLKLTPELLNKLIRRVLLGQLITSTEINPEEHGKAMAIMGIAEHYMPDRVKEIQLEQEEKATKRADRVKQRIEALKRKEVDA